MIDLLCGLFWGVIVGVIFGIWVERAIRRSKQHD
jgi:hypothetical protein